MHFASTCKQVRYRTRIAIMQNCKAAVLHVASAALYGHWEPAATMSGKTNEGMQVKILPESIPSELSFHSMEFGGNRLVRRMEAPEVLPMEVLPGRCALCQVSNVDTVLLQRLPFHLPCHHTWT